jgi:gamma-aminobutyric acid type B receptor
VSGLLGPGRSASSTATSIVADALYSVPVISWWATSVKLSSKSDFPMFGRVIAPDSLSADAIVAMCHFYGWTTVAVAGVDDDYGAPFVSDFLQKAALAQIRVISTFKWENGDTKQVQTAFNGLADSGARVFLALVFAIDMPAAWEVIKNRSLYGPGYLWISTDIIQLEAGLTDTMGGWLDGMIRCTARTYAEPGWGTLQSIFKTLQLAPLNNSFLDYPANLINRPLNDLASMLYDGVWLYAFALEKLMLQPNNTVDLSLSPGERLLEALKTTNFTGVSGRVALDTNGDRLFMGVSIQSFNLRDVALGFVEKGTWNQGDGIRMFAPMYWPGGLNEVPRDAATQIDKIEPVAEWAFVLVIVLCVLGTGLVAFVIAMHVIHRKEPVIQSSTPMFNIISVLGTLVIYTYLILCGSTDTPTSHGCGAMVWLLAIGFTLCFGPLFVKTHRIHAIFNIKQLKYKVRLTDNKLLGTLVVFLLFDIIICSIMSSLDNPVPVSVRFGSGIPSDSAPVPEFLIYNYYVKCKAKDETITTLLIVSKFAILAYGSYLAYRVRKIGLLQFNDSAHLAVAIYNTTLTACLAIGLSNLDTFRETPTARYVVLSLLIYYIATASIVIIHVPKLWAILTGTVDKWARKTGTGTSTDKNSRAESSINLNGTYIQALQQQIRGLGHEPVQQEMDGSTGTFKPIPPQASSST